MKRGDNFVFPSLTDWFRQCFGQRFTSQDSVAGNRGVHIVLGIFRQFGKVRQAELFSGKLQGMSDRDAAPLMAWFGFEGSLDISDSDPAQ